MMKRRRLNIKAILANPEARKKLFIETIIATQAREGITTTHEQALVAYYSTKERKQ